jgi:hypothetical protein
MLRKLITPNSKFLRIVHSSIHSGIHSSVGISKSKGKIEFLDHQPNNILFFGTGAVTNTLIALMNQFTDSITLVSNHADHLMNRGIHLHHKGTVHHVSPSSINVVKQADSIKNNNPYIIINGRQIGGNYDDIFDACSKETKFIVTAQNGQSSQALYKASIDYCSRKRERQSIIKNIIGIDAAMFVKMSSTDKKNKTILQPGAKWIFGAYSLKDGSGTGIEGSYYVNKSILTESEKFVDFFKLLGATDNDDNNSIQLNPQTISGKLMKTANNIGGNYGAAIITRLVQIAYEAEKKIGRDVISLEHPLPYGVLDPYFKIHTLEPYVGNARIDELYQQISDVRKISLNAVAEYYDINADHFNSVGLSKEDVLESARLYWTEMDENGDRVSSKHPPTHSLAIFERRPSEPLLDDVIVSAPNNATSCLQTLRDYHNRVEQIIPMPYFLKLIEKQGWLEGEVKNKIYENAVENDNISQEYLVSIKSRHYEKPQAPDPFLNGLQSMGEQAISYMERLGEYKNFYENIPTKNKPEFLNLTIGGVYRETSPRYDSISASRSYVTHLNNDQKEITAKIFRELGCNVNFDQVAISPMRAKLALQHALGLFKPGILVAHTPNYKATIDAAIKNFDHTVVDIDVRGRYGALFDEVRKQAILPENKGKPLILLLVCPQNPTAISMNDFEEKKLHSLIYDIPNLSVIHDIAYQGYHKTYRDAGKKYRDEGMPHKGQVYISILSTSKSMFASGQPALWFSDKNSFPFLVEHYQRVATGPTSTFVHDLNYYYETLDDTYMRSVEDNLQKPLLDFIDQKKDEWGVDYWVRPDGPPFITLDVQNKLKQLELTDKGFRELTLRLGCPVLVNDDCLRIALTGFDKSRHIEMLDKIKERLDYIFTLNNESSLIKLFKYHNPIYESNNI